MNRIFSLAGGVLFWGLLCSCNDQQGEMVNLNDDEQSGQEDQVSKEEKAQKAPMDAELHQAMQKLKDGTAQAKYELAKVYARRVKEGKEAIGKVVEWTEKAAEEGHDEAIMTLAGMYYTGTEIERDAAKAREWFEKAAQKGSREADLFLGRMYLAGDGVAQDVEQGWKYIREAAEAKIPAAMGMLGRASWEGIAGVEKQKDFALDLLKQAARKGDVQSAVMLGKIHYQGDLVAKDVQESYQWYAMAAKQGDPESQYIVALMLLEGEGAAKNEEDAVSWLKLAAGQDHVSAMAWLAVCYKRGWGVPKNESVGRVWEERARKLQEERQTEAGNEKK